MVSTALNTRRGTEVLRWQVPALLLVLAVAVLNGAYSIEPARLLELLNPALQGEAGGADRYVLLDLRLPRVLLGALVGAALAVAGAGAQGLFRNPLADPALIGVAMGAATGGVLWIVFGSRLLPGVPTALALPAAAVIGGLATTGMVYRLATRGTATEVATLLLAGIALNALGGAIIGVCVFNSDDQQLRDLNFWTLGSIAGANWQVVATVGLCAIPPLVLLLRRAPALNAFALGEANALFLGHDPQRVKVGIVVAVAILTSAAVAFCGVIAFVGLVAPHLVRMMAGPDHRVLLPGAAMTGAMLLVSADLLARTLVVPAELPVGLVMALLGAPFFLWLLARRQRGRA